MNMLAKFWDNTMRGILLFKYWQLIIPLMFIFALTASAQNQVLQLDGDGDYVQLPADIFNDLANATVEGWVKWDRFEGYSQPFGFGSTSKLPWRVMVVNNENNHPNLQFFFYVYMKVRRLYLIKVDGILRLGQWCHIAAVSGRDGMKLYFNGVLVGKHEFNGSFSALGTGKKNYFGKPHWGENDYFKGQLDEIRVWKVALPQKQIVAAMHRQLTGNEANLAGLWNFEHRDARDLSPNRYHGDMFGDAHCIEAELPSPSDLVRPATLSGVVTDEQGNALAKASVHLEQDGKLIRRTSTDNAGNYRIAVYPGPGHYYISAKWQDKGTWKHRVPLHQAEHRILNIRLNEQSVSISGTLRAWGNTLHNAVSVQAVRINSSTGGEEVVAATLSNEDGKYEFINLEPGSYLVRCHAMGEYIYYGQKGKGAKGQDAMRDGEILQIEPGKTLANTDFQFAPFKKGTWKNYSYLDGLSNSDVYVINQDADGEMLVGTNNGVYRYDGSKFVTLAPEYKQLAMACVQEIHRDSDGVLWFGTKENGVFRYERKMFINFTTEDGLADNNITAIHEGTDGVMWFGTNGGGVSRYDRK